MNDAQWAEVMPILRSLADSMARIAHVAEQGERRRGMMVGDKKLDLHDLSVRYGYEQRSGDFTDRDPAKAIGLLNRDA